MKSLRALIGAGHQIMIATLLFAGLSIVLDALFPGMFEMSPGSTGTAAGWALLLIGVPIWFSSAVQVAVHVPRGRLITSGPFRLVLHPLYTSVGLLVLPGIGLLAGSWIWIAIGLALYISSRVFSRREEEGLEVQFSGEYRRYRASVLLPWL